MNGKRQKTHRSVALDPAGEGEAFSGGSPRAEPFTAKPTSESPASTEQLMEEVCSRKISKQRGNAFEGIWAVLA